MLLGETPGLLAKCPDSYGLDTVCLRLFNVYGPSQTAGDYGGVIGKSVERLAQGSGRSSRATREQFRDFIHVRDVSDAFVRLAVSVGLILAGFSVLGAVSAIGWIFCSPAGVNQPVLR